MLYFTFLIGVKIESIKIVPTAAPEVLFSSDGTYPLPLEIVSSMFNLTQKN